MAQIGRTPFSFKVPDIGRFGGMSFETSNQPYQFELLENCYVSGGEIRAFPGSQVVLDPVTDARLATDTTPFSPRGYDRDHYDAQRPTYTTSGSYKVPTTPTESQLVWTRPTTLHSVHFLSNRWVFVGESDGRREPIYNAGRTAWVYVTAYQGVGGTDFDLTFNAAPDDSANVFNAVRAGYIVYLEGLTGDHATVLNNKQHIVSSVSGTTVRITTNYTGSSSAFTGQTGFVSLVQPSYAFTFSGTQTANEIGADLESLTVWRTQTNTASADSPDDLLYCSHVANRRRDFGDATGNIQEGSTETGYSFSRRIQKSLPYRVVPHHAGNRLVLAAPGYGCVFQVPHVVPSALDGTAGASGAGGLSNGDLDQPRALGVPKCVVVEDPDNASTNSAHIYDAGSDPADTPYAFGGSDAAVTARAGSYKWKFAYRDEATGEIGIPSDTVTVTTTTGSVDLQGLKFAILFPGYLMPECLAYSILAYRTTRNGEEFYLNEVIPMKSLDPTGSAINPGDESGKYGLKPAGNASTVGYWFHVVYKPLYKTDADLEAASGDNVMPDGNQQMPMGCKAAYTYRGYTLFGGALGNSGPWRELQTGMLEARYTKIAGGVNAVAPNHDRLLSRFGTGSETPFISISTPFNIGSAIIPPAYAGQQLYCPKILPYPAQLVTLDVMTNTAIGTSDGWWSERVRIPDVQYKILNSPIRSTTDYSLLRDECFLILPRNQVQVSNPDHPGETPATNTIVVANEHGEDVEAMGSYAGQPVLATRTKTYMLGFATTPVGANPEIVSDRFGCIAPNTMVEFDGGCAWISDRGPVALTGNGFQWIGKPLQKWFAESTSRYKRDSLGMMRHAWGCHDPIRGLIYFGLFADLQAGTAAEATVSYRGTSYSWTDTNGVGSLTADQIRSRFPCDEVLVYNYRDDAWSVWRPHDDLAVQWMTVGQDAERNLRVFWLGSDKRLYALDDLWGTLDDDSSYTALSTSGSVTTLSGLTTGVRMRVGMDVAFYKGGAGTELEFVGLRTIASKTDTTITLDSAITLPVGGCKMLVGPRRFTVKTNWSAWKQSDPASVGKLGMRFALWSGYSTSGGNGVRHAAFAKATVRTASKQDGYTTRKESSLTAGGYSPLGEDVSEIQTFETGLAQGFSQGHSFQIELDVVGGTQVRLQDLFVEVG